MNNVARLDSRPSTEHAFLPAALEVRDTPPSPMGRAIVWVILLFFVLAILWASFGKIDIVAVASGRIIPNGHSKVIQPLETGTVSKLHVREGQHVNKGDLLVELDSTSVAAEVQRLQQELDDLAQQMQRLQIIHTLIAEGHRDLADLSDQQTGLGALQNRLLHSQWQEFIESRITLQKKINKELAQSETLERQIGKLKATLPLIEQRAGDMETLLKTNAVARHRVLEVQQEKLSAEHDLKTLLSQREEHVQTIAELQARSNQQLSEFKKSLIEELNQASQKHAAFTQEIIKARVRQSAQTLTAPVNGVVQQLAIHTIGGVVTPAQELMMIVPEKDTLEVEALLENKDIGFVEEGQQVEVKIDAFPFTKYGTIDGVLTDISNDAIMDEVKGLVFKTQVSLQRSLMQIDKRVVQLTPGMSVTVEVKTGTRRVIEFFLAPLLRYKQESIRER